MALFHKVGAAHQHGLAMDGGLHAALLAVTQVVHANVEPALRRELAVQQGSKAAAGGTGHRSGVAHGAAAFLAVDLVAVEGHGTGGEEIVIGEHHAAGAGHGTGTGIAGGGSAAALQAAGQVVQGQGAGQGQGQLDTGAGEGGQHPGELVHGAGGEAHHAG